MRAYLTHQTQLGLQEHSPYFFCGFVLLARDERHWGSTYHGGRNFAPGSVMMGKGTFPIRLLPSETPCPSVLRWSQFPLLMIPCVAPGLVLGPLFALITKARPRYGPRFTDVPSVFIMVSKLVTKVWLLWCFCSHPRRREVCLFICPLKFFLSSRLSLWRGCWTPAVYGLYC